MITTDGHAKVLDFGLAKLVEAPTSTENVSNEDPTILQHSTPGLILGTMGYMSPEQAQGKTKEIDHRSDIFSFGCILFEAITRKKAFSGKDQIETLNKIIREPAPPLSAINPNAPAELQRIVRRCLAKDPDERYQSIKDVAIELKEVRREMQEGSADTTVPPVSSASSEARTSWHSETTRVQSSPTATAEPLSSPVDTRFQRRVHYHWTETTQGRHSDRGSNTCRRRRRCSLWNSILLARGRHRGRRRIDRCHTVCKSK